ncbi:MAG: hypothetical protein CYG60_03340 [Actinobacteria bacterium]|nr:MAG: hypothetical protein CYG60_03340 [Actinomycetota bacterium]
MAKSAVPTLKAELMDRHPFHTREPARVAILENVGGFYNRMRRLSSLGGESTGDYEAARMKEATVA